MRMKRVFSILLFVIMVFISTMPVTATVDDSVRAQADALTKLGILKGSTDGLLKRSEASTFVVRLLGKESIIDSYSTSNYPDVPLNAWYTPYVGYCTFQGILAGYPDGNFHPDENISEKAFLKMLLVTLGYTYSEDFSWSNVYQKAYIAGIVQDSSYASKTVDNTNYSRALVVKALYNTLKQDHKTTGVKMIQSLIDDNVISKELALSTGILQDTVQTEVQSITATGTNVVSVKFNEQLKPLTDNDVFIFAREDASETLTVKLLSQVNGEIIISTSNQTADKEYCIEISNVNDLQGNKIDSLTGDFTGYRSPELKSDFFRISKVVPVGKNTVNLYFTHPITANSEIPTYYEIMSGNAVFVEGSTKTMTVKRIAAVDNAVSIYLKDAIFIGGEKYTLKVKGDFTSLYTVKLNDGNGEGIYFKGNESDNTALGVTGITPISSTSIEVEFSKEVDASFSQKFLNYTVIGPNNTSIAVTKAVLDTTGDKAGKVVRLTLMTALDKTKTYEMRFEYIPDVYRESFLESYSVAFDGLYSTEKTNLKIEFAAALDKGTVQVYFDKALNPITATMPVYYNIYGTNSGYISTPVKVSYEEVGGEYKAKLYLSNDKLLSPNSIYKVRVLSSMQDIKGTVSSQNAEYSFTGSDTNVQKPGIAEAIIISNDTIKVRYNRDLVTEAPNTLTSNYSLNYVIDDVTLSKEPISVIPIDSTTFVLKYDSLDYKTKYKLRFKSLKDITGISNTITTTEENIIDVVNGK